MDTDVSTQCEGGGGVGGHWQWTRPSRGSSPWLLHGLQESLRRWGCQTSTWRQHQGASYWPLANVQGPAQTHSWGKWNWFLTAGHLSAEVLFWGPDARGQSGSIVTGLTGLWWCSTHTRGGGILYILKLLWWNHLSSSVGWGQPLLHSPSPSSPAHHGSLLNKYEW